MFSYSSKLFYRTCWVGWALIAMGVVYLLIQQVSGGYQAGWGKLGVMLGFVVLTPLGILALQHGRPTGGSD